MNEEQKKAINTSIPELLRMIQVNTTFEAAIRSSELWDSDIAGNLFKGSSGKELLFKLLLKLRKVQKQDVFLKFLDLLKELKLKPAADLLQRELARHTEIRKDKDKANNHLTSVTASSDGPPKVDPVSATSSSLSSGSWLTLQEGIRKVLPPKNTKKPGFIAVSDSYYRQVYKFATAPKGLETKPGPIEAIDLSKNVYGDTFSFLPRACCDKLSEAFGGKPQLELNRISNHDVLCSLEGETKYCAASVVLQPGSITKCWCWLSVDSRLGEALRELVTWKRFSAKTGQAGGALDLLLSMTVGEWRIVTPSYTIQIYQVDYQGSDLSVSEKRDVIHQDLSSASHEDDQLFYLLVTRGYYLAVTEFSAEERDVEPGPVMVPNKSAALNPHNIGFLPPECVSTLISFYGGQASLRKCKYRGPLTLVDADNHSQYYEVTLYLHSPDSVLVKQGTYLFGRTANLNIAIASAVGYSPSRAYSRSSREDIGLQTNVRVWFDCATTNEIVIELESHG